MTAPEALKQCSGNIFFSKEEMGWFKKLIWTEKHINELISVRYVSNPKHRHSLAWTIIKTYAPTDQVNYLEFTALNNKLSEVLISFSNNCTIKMGDFNGQVRTKLGSGERIIGNFGHGKRSTNGMEMKYLLLWLLEKKY